MVIFLAGGAVLFHSITAILALRLIRITGRYLAWGLFSTGIAIAAVRRAITFFMLLSGNPLYNNLPDELFAFAISAFFLSGVIFIHPLFSALKDSERLLRQAKESLEEENSENSRLISELQAALDSVKVLKGMLPICTYCKKIRDDAGYWKQLETYISTHSEAEFSHGICPDCFKKNYPDIRMPEGHMPAE